MEQLHALQTLCNCKHTQPQAVKIEVGSLIGHYNALTVLLACHYHILNIGTILFQYNTAQSASQYI